MAGHSARRGRTSLRYLYRLTPDSLDLVLAASDSIFDWVNPDLPEDLHLLRGDGSTVLGSVAQEDAVWVEGSEYELDRMLADRWSKVLTGAGMTEFELLSEIAAWAADLVTPDLGLQVVVSSETEFAVLVGNEGSWVETETYGTLQDRIWRLLSQVQDAVQLESRLPWPHRDRSSTVPAVKLSGQTLEVGYQADDEWVERLQLPMDGSGRRT